MIFLENCRNHIDPADSSQSRKRRSSDSEKKIGLSNELDLVAQRLLDNKDGPRIKTTVHVDSDAESEITLAPSMVLNEGSALSSKRCVKINYFESSIVKIYKILFQSKSQLCLIGGNIQGRSD